MKPSLASAGLLLAGVWAGAGLTNQPALARQATAGANVAAERTSNESRTIDEPLAPEEAIDPQDQFQAVPTTPAPPLAGDPPLEGVDAGADGLSLPFFHFTGGELCAPDRHVGRGDPLVGTSWLNRPWNASWFFGGLVGDELQSGDVAFDDGWIGGYRFGYDFDHYWGAEARYGFGHPSLVNLANDLPLGGGQIEFLDASLLYYPWGDAAWRPYAFIGLGAAWLAFQDEDQRYLHVSALTMPWGLGVKRRLDKHWVLRMEVADQFIFAADGADAMHQWTVTGGVEVHFGGRRPSYFPWDSGIHLLW